MHNFSTKWEQWSGPNSGSLLASSLLILFCTYWEVKPTINYLVPIKSFGQSDHFVLRNLHWLRMTKHPVNIDVTFKLEQMSSTNFSIAFQCYTEIKQSNWLKLVKWIATFNHNTLIQGCIVMLRKNLSMTLAPGRQTNHRVSK